MTATEPDLRDEEAAQDEYEQTDDEMSCSSTPSTVYGLGDDVWADFARRHIDGLHGQTNEPVNSSILSRHLAEEPDPEFCDLLDDKLAALEDVSLVPTQPADATGSVATASSSTLGKRKSSSMTNVNASTDSFQSKKFKPSTSYASLVSLSRAKLPDASDSLKPKTFKSAAELEADDPFVEHPVTSASNDADALFGDTVEPYNHPVIIAYNPILQKVFETRNVPFGVRWEIARLLTLQKQPLTVESIQFGHLLELGELGSNAKAAPKTHRTLIGRGSEDGNSTVYDEERAATTPWEEMDKEEALLDAADFRGYLASEHTDPSQWTGGKIALRAKLRCKGNPGKNPELFITVEHAELSTSSRFSRRFGSTSFLHLKLTKEAQRVNPTILIKFLKRPFILWDSVFRFFLESNGSCTLYRTDESYVDRVLRERYHSKRLTLLEFLEWHNPIEKNAKQTMTKWASRFALGQSTSVPGLQLKPSQVFEEPDIVSSEGSDMTDGCGYINFYALQAMKRQYLWDDLPTALQVRVLGAKGLLVLHPTDFAEEPRVWLRPSMIKVKYGDEIDSAQLVIDVLRISHTSTPSRLNYQTIINLYENKVPWKAILRLFDAGLEELTHPFLDWDNPDFHKNIWLACSSLGAVQSARKARKKAWMARINGGASYGDDDLEEDEDEVGINEIREKSTAWWADQTSGQPSSLEETVMYAIDGGFTLQESPVLRDKCHKMLKPHIDRYVKSYRPVVLCSCTAFIAPDPTGRLEEGQIFFKSSRRNLQWPDGTMTDLVLGPVLVTRNPCRIITDMQKWQAVDIPALRNFPDVIFFSVKGPRRAADYLAGGDYDGDKALLIFDLQLVDRFQNADLSYSVKPDISSSFRKENESVTEFLERTKTIPERLAGMQDVLLGGLRNPADVGTYSALHENAIYKLGYSHAETIRLAFMFCDILDGAKTGLRVRPDVLADDQKKYYAGHSMDWRNSMAKSHQQEQQQKSNIRLLPRPEKLGKFIMDKLSSHAHDQGDAFKSRIERKFNELGTSNMDLDLARPYLDALARGQRKRDLRGDMSTLNELSQITTHVQEVRVKHRERSRAPGSPSKARRAGFTSLAIEDRQDILRQTSREFHAGPNPSEMLEFSPVEFDLVRASYAYVHDYEECQKRKRVSGSAFTRFPWDVCMRRLCNIKCSATGREKTVLGSFYEEFYMKGKWRS